MPQDPFDARFVRVFRAGEVIFREADEGAQMYVIQQGTVGLSRRFSSGERTLATLGPGEFFGEMAILNGRPRSAKAVAVSDVRALELDEPTLTGMLHRSGAVALRLVRRLSLRLDSSNSLVEILLHADPRARVILAIARAADESADRGEAGVRVRGDVSALARELGLGLELVTEVVAGLLRVRVLLSDRDGTWIVSEPQRLRAFVELVGSSTTGRD